MNGNYTAIIQHGTGGTRKENWFPWLAEELENLGVNVIVPQLPTPVGQNLETWKLVYRELLPEINSNTIFVGHSLAPAFILRFLLDVKKPVGACFFVAAFMSLLGRDDFDSLNCSFVEGEIDWESARSLVGECTVYNADNDPYVPIELGKNFASNLNAEFVEIQGGGHINTGSGYTQFSLLLQDIKSFLNK